MPPSTRTTTPTSSHIILAGSPFGTPDGILTALDTLLDRNYGMQRMAQRTAWILC